MIPGDFGDFFLGLVGVTGALIGLLFVAVSLAPRRLRESKTGHLAQTQASAALLVFTNAMVLGLSALMPGDHIGWVAVIVAFLGIVACAAVGRVAWARLAVDRSAAIALGTIAGGAVVILALEGVGGIEILVAPHSTTGIYTLCWTVIAALLFGITRAWELVGLRGNGLFSSIETLYDPAAANPIDGPEDPLWIDPTTGPPDGGGAIQGPDRPVGVV